MDDTKKRTENESRERIVRQRTDCIIDSLTQLATAAGQVMTEERTELYCRALVDLNSDQLQHAFNEALLNLGDFMPTIRELRAYARQYATQEQIIDDTKRIRSWQKDPELLALPQGTVQQWLDEAKQRSRDAAKLIAEHAESSKNGLPSTRIEKRVEVVTAETIAEFDRRRREQLEAFQAKNPELQRSKDNGACS